MDIKEFLNYRLELLNEAKDQDSFINEGNFITTIIPLLLDAKLIDNEDFIDTYYSAEIDNSNIKINGYLINESGERLQLFILNDESILNNSNLSISQKEYYDNIFKKAINFTNKSIKGHLNEIQDIGAINALIHQMSSTLGADQFDVIEIFLITATATIETRGERPQPKRIEFKDESINIKFSKNNVSKNKEIILIKKLIDLNFLYSIIISQGNREPLKIDFFEDFNFKIEAIKAADEENFESFLCVMPATILSKLYLKYSSRLLEKNVRSFLQFRGVNLGMRNTLSKEPEKFIAYNNGLTITASEKEIEEINGKIYLKSLSDFQIVNGGQTTASIYFSQKDGINIDKVKIMAKINVAKNVEEEVLNDLISNISEYSNSQSKVSSVDLRSRNPQLGKIKSLSESIITPSGKKWFFEKAKGEFNTKLRIAGASGKNRIEKEYPKEYRFSKEQLGKYYCSWGDEPYKVKKGGENIFRKFLEDIGSDDKNKVTIDRYFYEILIAKIILFKSLENIHGAKSGAIGQLRSVVVPYAISTIYIYTEGNKKNQFTFDLSKIWAKEGLGDDLAIFTKDLMILINDLIKIYAKSDDFGEYSKKKELWDDISSSKEMNQFMSLENSVKILEKYSVLKKEVESKIKQNKKNIEVDFELLSRNAQIHSNNSSFYKNIEFKLIDFLTENEKIKLAKISGLIQQKTDLDRDLVEYEEKLIQKMRVEHPEIFDEANLDANESLQNAFTYIVKKYNFSISKSENIISIFEGISNLAVAKNIRFNSVFTEIGKLLTDGKAPNIKQLYMISENIHQL